MGLAYHPPEKKLWPTPLTKSNKKEHSHSCNFCVLGTKFKIDVIYCTYKNGRRSSQGGGQQRELRLEKHYYHQVWENIIFPFKSSVAWGTPSNPKSPLRSYGGFFCVCQKYAPSSEVPLLALYIVALAVPLSIELYHAALSRNFLLSKKKLHAWLV